MQKVKTIWNVDRALTISSFYYPASIRTPDNRTQKLEGLNDFPANHVVLEGTVGQGKSILMRWLLGREARSGERIPIFIELRRVPIAGFDNFVVNAFSDLIGTPADIEIFEAFAANGRISLLLDGFDELDPANESSIANSVERHANLFPQTRILITARPDSGIQNSANFDVIQIAKLTKESLPNFFNKILSRDKELAKRLIAAIQASGTISDLISTPLLATLLTIVYRAHQRIPLDFSEFYEELFQILLIRHDKSKTAYERHRKTKLSDRQMQEAFEAFSFKSKANSKSSIPRSEAINFAKDSLIAARVDCDESAFLTDVKKITCLLSEEGGRIEFIHQSVQEFFAAKYIKSRPEQVIANFYGKLLENAKWTSWKQEIIFLEQIDRYRTCKYFLIPAIKKTLDHLESQTKPAPPSILRQKITDLLGVAQEISQTPHAPPRYIVFQTRRQPYYLISMFENRVFSLLFSRPDWRLLFDGHTQNQRLKYSEIADRTDQGLQLDQTLDTCVHQLYREIKTYQNFVDEADASNTFMSI